MRSQFALRALTVLAFALTLTGCCGFGPCVPCPAGGPCVTSCCPQTAASLCPPPARYSQPQWPYYDQQGTRRLMPDSHLREHLRIPPSPPAESFGVPVEPAVAGR